jgi:predicted DNA-binding ribbon-helix-helix protein
MSPKSVRRFWVDDMHQEQRKAGRANLKSRDTLYVVKRSVTIRGHRTSFSLEQPFFEALVEIAARRGMSIAALVAEIDGSRPRGANLSSALRVFVLEDARQRQG